jgi:hypothetical protein
MIQGLVNNHKARLFWKVKKHAYAFAQLGPFSNLSMIKKVIYAAGLMENSPNNFSHLETTFLHKS